MLALEYRSLLTPDLVGWRMAGDGGFAVHDDIIESYGGPGILWYARDAFEDFVLRVEWRLTTPTDSSSIFLRIPPLGGDLHPAIVEGYEVQIDDRGIDQLTGRLDSPLHRSGAICGFAPAIANASQPVGIWNDFEIAVQGPMIDVTLNDVPVARLEGARRRGKGHIGLQAYHEDSTIQFRRCDIRTL